MSRPVSVMRCLDWTECPNVESVPGKVSGAWVFRGTRMPVQTVFENLYAPTFSTLSTTPPTGIIDASSWAYGN